MINKLSLRMRITLMTTLILISISLVLTVTSMFNVSHNLLAQLTTKGYLEDSRGIDSAITDQSITDGELKNETLEWLEYNNIQMKAQETAIANGTKVFRSYAIISMLVIIVISSIFTYFILGRMLSPVKKLSEEIELINEKKLSKRVTGFNSGDELNELADSFNIMLDRIDKAFKSQKRFSSDAAHELKTPLTVMKTNLDVLALDEYPTNEDYKHIVSVFEKQTDRMINLVNNLFVMAAQKEYDFNDIIDLNTIFTDIISDLEQEIAKKQIRISLNKNNISIKANAIMLTHGLSNLVENAVKYNDYGGDIIINLEEKENNCVIRIQDTGIGIPEDKAEHIFDAFYRVDKSRSRKVGGAGLGLAITKDIINAHGGTIEYISNETKGSIFQIVLPIIKN
ncbi:MAG: HAMP domain-containing sensor histidine kinase [Clostridium celatum]|nr:HAMP domain-containing sensor histidine kinase [Clostridium celatum]